MADRQVGDGLYVKLGIDYSGMIGGAAGVSIALNQTLELFSKFEGMAQRFIDLANNAGRVGQEIKDNARDLGLSTSQYQQWTHAMVAAGGRGEDLTSVIRIMSTRIGEARDPTSNMSMALKALGVSALDSTGKMRPMHDFLLDLFPALNRLPEGFERNEAAAAIMGRGFANVADLASMSREKLQALVDMPPAFSDEKVRQLDEYNARMQLLNEKTANLSVEIGQRLVPAFENFLSMFDGEKGQGFLNVLDFGVARLNEMIFLLQASAQWVALSANGNLTLQEKQQQWGEWVDQYKNTWAEITDTGLKGDDLAWADAERRFGVMRESLSYAPASGKATGVLTAEEIRDKKLELRELTNITIPDLTKKLKEARLTGLKTDIEIATIALEKATNRANDLRVAVGAPSASAATYNSVFASSLNAGGVGPDWAGMSNLADMTAEELQEVIDKGALGGSKAEAEKAQMYKSMLASSGKSTVSGTEKKADTLADQAKTDTKTIDTELTKQADAYKTLGEKIKEGWADLETTGLIHYFALSEMSRIRSQAELDYMASCVNFGGQNPIVQNKIIMSKDGPDWNPPAFVAITAPTLKEADFSTVKFSSQGAGSAGAGGGVKVEVNQVINEVDKNTTNKVTNATVTGVSKALAGVDKLGGSMI